jgi:hypothetical protein
MPDADTTNSVTTQVDATGGIIDPESRRVKAVGTFRPDRTTQGLADSAGGG